jgi:transposase
VEVLGPIAVDSNWQAKAGAGFDQASFKVDWQAQKVICPAGKESRQWKISKDPKISTIKICWAHSDCVHCEVRRHCTKTKDQLREISLQPQAQHEVTLKIRQQQTSAEFKLKYGQRAGIEGTMSQAVRRGDALHARYIGLNKTHFQQLGMAAGLNLIRFGEWLAETPLAKTRTTAFARLKLAR